MTGEITIEYDARFLKEEQAPTKQKKPRSLTAQEQADVAAEELRNEDSLKPVYSDFDEMMEALKHARGGVGDGETIPKIIFRPNGPTTIPPGTHNLENVLIDGSGTKGGRGEIKFDDGAFVANCTNFKDVDLVVSGVAPLIYKVDKGPGVPRGYQALKGGSLPAPKATKKRNRGSHPVDGKKRRGRRDYGAAGKGFNAKGNR